MRATSEALPPRSSASATTASTSASHPAAPPTCCWHSRFSLIVIAVPLVFLASRALLAPPSVSLRHLRLLDLFDRFALRFADSLREEHGFLLAGRPERVLGHLLADDACTGGRATRTRVNFWARMAHWKGRPGNSPSIRWNSSTSYCVTSVTDLPLRPARAVRPTRWM